MDHIKIESLELYTDSMISLNRIQALHNDFAKLKEPSVFVKNCLRKISSECQYKPVQFLFIKGGQNPSDLVTRICSYKKLLKTNYFQGPDWLKDRNAPEDNRLSITVPHPLARAVDKVGSVCSEESEEKAETSPESSCEVQVEQCFTSGVNLQTTGFFVDPKDYSSFHKLVMMHRHFFKLIQNWKRRVNTNIRSDLFPDSGKLENCYLKHIDMSFCKTRKSIFLVFEFFEKENVPNKDIPSIVNKFNIIKGSTDGLLRIKSKFQNLASHENDYPILLSKNSYISDLIHERMDHAGVYSVLNEARKEFWIIHYFSKVRKVLKWCVDCRRYNNQTIKLNQSPYRDFRCNPPEQPYKSIFLIM